MKLLYVKILLIVARFDSIETLRKPMNVLSTLEILFTPWGHGPMVPSFISLMRIEQSFTPLT